MAIGPIRDAPGAGPQYYERALEYLRRGRRSRAVRDLRAAFEWDSALVKRAKAEPLFAPLLRDPFIAPSTAKGSPLAKAVGMLHRERFEDALSAAEALVKADAKDAPAWFVVSLATASLEEWERSLDAATRACEADPAFVDAHFNRGAAFEALGQDDEAMAAYRKALALEPDHDSSAFNLILVLRRLERHEDARAIGEATLRELPEAQMLRYKHAETFAILEDPDRALAQLAKLAELDPQCREAVPDNEHFAPYLTRADWTAFVSQT